jgi:aspergillopepsin I
VYSDIVTIGGVSVPLQAVEAVLQASTSFTADTASLGLIGMAFSSFNNCRRQQQLTRFDNVKSTLAARVWTANPKRAAAGTYNFGYIDIAAYAGSIACIPVSPSSRFCEFTISGYAFGSSKFVTTNLDAITDIGTTLLLLPAAVSLRTGRKPNMHI